jgi:hypothetical protein
VNVLDDFVRTACTALGVDEAAVDRDLVLRMTADVAHNVARPAAPVAAFVAGLAAGRSGGDAAAVRGAVERLAQLAQGYVRGDGE